MSEFILVESVARLQLQPGDTVVLRSARPLTSEQRQHLLAVLTHHFPHNKGMVLDGGLSLEVVSKEGATA